MVNMSKFLAWIDKMLLPASIKLAEAIRDKNAERVKEIIIKHPNLLDKFEKPFLWGHPLQRAVCEEWIEGVLLLLRMGADPNVEYYVVPTRPAYHVLQSAVHLDNKSLTTLLLVFGARCDNIFYSSQNTSVTPALVHKIVKWCDESTGKASALTIANMWRVLAENESEDCCRAYYIDQYQEYLEIARGNGSKATPKALFAPAGNTLRVSLMSADASEHASEELNAFVSHSTADCVTGSDATQYRALASS